MGQAKNLLATAGRGDTLLLRLAEAVQAGKRNWDRTAASGSVASARRLFARLSRGPAAAWLQDVRVGVGSDDCIAITAGSGDVVVHIEADTDTPTFVGIAEARASRDLIEACEGLSLDEAVEFLRRHLGH